MAHIQEITYTDQLKGLAIIAVVALHVISNLPGAWVTDPSHLPYILAIDQIGRFCVPLFVAISGFGLMRKYMVKKFELVDFLKRRVWRLLPLYLVWVTASLLIFHFSNAWNWMGQDLTYLLKIGLGRADYHLYFVPMILQLYLLFPVLMVCVRKFPKSTLVASAVIQAGLYAVFSWWLSGHLTLPFKLNDQREYVTSLSWIFYFVLGMYLALKLEKKKKPTWEFASLLLFGVGLVWTTVTGLKAIPGTDTIQILRFTRFPVFFYATGAILLGLSGIQHFKLSLWKPIAFLGKHSYLIYLSHPLVLRVLAGGYFGTIDLWSLTVASLGITVAIVISLTFHLE